MNSYALEPVGRAASAAKCWEARHRTSPSDWRNGINGGLLRPWKGLGVDTIITWDLWDGPTLEYFSQLPRHMFRNCRVLIAIAIGGAALTGLAADIHTLDNQVYHNARIIAHTPSDATILHANGVARVPLQLLPLRLQRQFGFNLSAATKYREQEAQRQKEYDAQMSRERALAEQSKLQQDQDELAKAEAQRIERAKHQTENEELAQQQTTKQRQTATVRDPATAPRSQRTADVAERDALLPPDANYTEEVDAVKIRTAAISKGGATPLGKNADIEEIEVYYSSRIRTAAAAGKTELAAAWKEQGKLVIARWLGNRLPH